MIRQKVSWGLWRKCTQYKISSSKSHRRTYIFPRKDIQGFFLSHYVSCICPYVQHNLVSNILSTILLVISWPLSGWNLKGCRNFLTIQKDFTISNLRGMIQINQNTLVLPPNINITFKQTWFSLAVWQTPSSLINLVSHSFTHWSFSSQSSNHH